EHLQWLDRPYRAEAPGGMRADPAVELEDFPVVQPRVGLGNRHQPITVPHTEGVVGIQRAAPPVTALRVQHHRIDGEWVDLPFPPVAPLATVPVGRSPTFEHE